MLLAEVRSWLREGCESFRGRGATLLLLKLGLDDACCVFRVGIFKHFQTGSSGDQIQSDSA